MRLDGGVADGAENEVQDKESRNILKLTHGGGVSQKTGKRLRVTAAKHGRVHQPWTNFSVKGCHKGSISDPANEQGCREANHKNDQTLSVEQAAVLLEFGIEILVHGKRRRVRQHCAIECGTCAILLLWRLVDQLERLGIEQGRRNGRVAARHLSPPFFLFPDSKFLGINAGGIETVS